jgi:hypothetical protein
VRERWVSEVGCMRALSRSCCLLLTADFFKTKTFWWFIILLKMVELKKLS